MVQIEQFDANVFQTSNWSGGKTTELYLFPPSGSYQQRDFEYRLSTATVDVAESQFTALPGIQRLLMTLDKPITLTQIGEQKEVHLDPFVVHSFSGNDEIKSKGQCQDFNVMYTAHYSAELAPIAVGQLNIKSEGIQFIYALDELAYTLNEISGVLPAHHLMKITRQSHDPEVTFTLTPHDSSLETIAIWVGFVYNKDRSLSSF
ncbi:hypothetical protein GGG87_08065 [Streptococcus sp. zg-86]|uniref:HutD family protein n=1 Tax=Streptococcus zhangguiae TaxID=2664091 RepID=A0A6I4RS17_9STRE|nr:MULTISPECIES: HutD family protein [unclassified Streptococcus]MTB64950.1 hypothetical protein [Streptococcus sp. zg-86]MTB91164.1 hypothetical protein [Streptococcus sp. zg-36]MWV56965.1 hypothetical protein [Streptococcus sp. zg-70]QTH47201.1 HutD family protein [Streptococcus sp. zg-86]